MSGSGEALGEVNRHLRHETNRGRIGRRQKERKEKPIRRDETIEGDRRDLHSGAVVSRLPGRGD